MIAWNKMEHLPFRLRHDLRAVVEILITHCPERARDIERFGMAVQNPGVSRLLSRRFSLLVDNCMNGGARYTLNETEKRELGHVLLALKEIETTGKPGPKAAGYEYRLMIYLTADQHDALQSYCQRANLSRAQAVRLALQDRIGTDFQASASIVTSDEEAQDEIPA
jgi:hypothetical protein